MSALKNALSGQVSPIIKKLGAKQGVSSADFAKLLAESPALAQHICAYANRQGNHPQISNQILLAIVESIGEPFGQTSQVTSLNEIKKRFRKLNNGHSKSSKRTIDGWNTIHYLCQDQIA